jgi:hypothetical protein
MPALIVPLLAPDLILRISIKGLFFFCPHSAASGRSDGEEVVRESYLSGVVLARFVTAQPLLARSQLNDGDDGTRTRGLRRESGPAIGLYNKIAGSAKGRLSW